MNNESLRKQLTVGHSDTRQPQELERRIFMLIEQKQRQIRRIRVVVAIAWILLVIVVAMGAVAEGTSHRLLSSTLAMIARGVLLGALVLTVSWYVRSVSLRFDSIRQALAAIQDRLEGLPKPEDGGR
ncbi:MAG: hypothetical protein ACYC6N_12700 [Pirellulaceae bacterium]